MPAPFPEAPPPIDEESVASAIPHSREAEEAVIGSVFINPDVWHILKPILAPEDFYIHRHRWIWESFLDLDSFSHPMDMLTVSERLEDKGQLDELGGPAYLTALINQVPSSLNAKSYARIVEAHSVRRKMLERANNIARLAYDVEKDIESALHDYGEMTRVNEFESSFDDNTQSSDVVSLELLELIESGSPTGVLTGFPNFDSFDALGGHPIGATLLIGDSSFGKCFGRGTLIRMADGTLRSVENVVVGDFVMGVDSSPRKVLAQGRGRGQMYWIHQKKGISYRVNDAHILALKRSTSRGNRFNHRHGDSHCVSVKEYNSSLPFYSTHYKGYKVSCEMPVRNVPVEPYFLGLWLGDGRSSDARIFSVDNEIIGYLEGYAKKRGEKLNIGKSNPRCFSYNITLGLVGNACLHKNSIRNNLKRLDLLNNKHIPDIYLYNSKDNRLKLLAGLIDSDGYIPKQSRCNYEITQKDFGLAKDIKKLCDSLGYRVTIKEKIARCQNGSETLVHRVYFGGNVNEIPVRVERKKAREWTDFRDWTVCGIEVVKDRVDNYYGFTLDGDGLFLLEDNTVTHNSAWELQKCEQIARHFNKKVIYFGFEARNVQNIIRRVSGQVVGMNHLSKKIRSATLSTKERDAVANAIKDYQGSFGDPSNLLFNFRDRTLRGIERAIRKHKPVYATIDQINQITDVISTNPVVNMLSKCTKLKEMGDTYGCAISIVHAITAEESRKFFKDNEAAQKSTSGKKNKMPDINAIPWSTQMKFIVDVILFLVPEVNQQLVGATEYKINIWIMKDRDGDRFVWTKWKYDLKKQWFTDLSVKRLGKNTAQIPSGM